MSSNPFLLQTIQNDMQPYRYGIIFVGIAVFFVRTPVQAGSQAAQETKEQRGDYLTHHVAMCVQCHTPRNAAGQLIKSREFQGAPVPVQKPSWGNQWAPSAPTIAGLPGWSEEEAIHFLQTGERYDGTRPNPPMPPFRMSHDDAEAVVAYLESLR